MWKELGISIVTAGDVPDLGNGRKRNPLLIHSASAHGKFRLGYCRHNRHLPALARTRSMAFRTSSTRAFIRLSLLFCASSSCLWDG